MASLRLTNSHFHQGANSLAHRTNEFKTEKQVVRRGQPFKIILVFNRAFQSTDSLSLTAETGPFPSVSTNTKVVMPITSASSGTSWSAVSESMTSPMTVTLNPPANAVIGHYRLSLNITSGGHTTYNRLEDFILLFNPWATSDEVYMNSDAEKSEYVLEETGLIFCGSAFSRQSRYWDYGQFEEDILDITLSLLDRNTNYRKDPAKDVARRHDPGYVGRVLSAMVNSNDDYGVIIGNWRGSSSGGTEPTQWNGSVPILRQWIKAGPVGFGQCWVFAGVLCTVLRCLGIPSRLITNFESAHDTDQNLIVDRYVDEDGKELTETDSVWNFHVWNEGWFVRKDLGSNYNGWQVLDATPQEQSGGLFRLGPCSVKAVKEGDVDLDYDTPFVFAETNADVIDWMVHPDGSVQKVHSDTRSVGRYTSTKAVGSYTREDVTKYYKYDEGTDKEREIFLKAQDKLKDLNVGMRPRGLTPGLGGDLVRDALPAPKPDFSATFNQSNETQVGEDLLLSLTLKNTSGNSKSLNIKMTATAIVYTNAPMREILIDAQATTLEPHEDKKNIQLTISYSQYQDALTTDNMIRVVAMCEDDIGLHLVVYAVFTLKSPPIHIKISDEACVNEPLHVEITFFNPISETLENGVVTIDGTGLVKRQIKIEVMPLQSKEKCVLKLDIVPYKAGQRNLLVDFSCNKFFDVKGFALVNVTSDKPTV